MVPAKQRDLEREHRLGHRHFDTRFERRLTPDPRGMSSGQILDESLVDHQRRTLPIPISPGTSPPIEASGASPGHRSHAPTVTHYAAGLNERKPVHCHAAPRALVLFVGGDALRDMTVFPAPEQTVSTSDERVLYAAVAAHRDRYRGQSRLYVGSDLKILLNWRAGQGLDPPRMGRAGDCLANGVSGVFG